MYKNINKAVMKINEQWNHLHNGIKLQYALENNEHNPQNNSNSDVLFLLLVDIIKLCKVSMEFCNKYSALCQVSVGSNNKYCGCKLSKAFRFNRSPDKGSILI